MKYRKLSAALNPNPQRHPRCTTARAITGTPIALENFAAASNSAVDVARSVLGNQYPVALAFAGKLGASAAPSISRPAKMPTKPPAQAVTVAARVQRNALQRP